MLDQHFDQGRSLLKFILIPLTIRQYPWYMVDFITIEDRNMLHEATKTMLTILIERVNNEDQNVNINKMLLKRVWRTALRCPGFTPSMKDDIVFIAGLSDETAIEYGIAPYASFWNKLWCIGPKPNVPVDVILVSFHSNDFGLRRPSANARFLPFLEADLFSGILARSAMHASPETNSRSHSRPKWVKN